MTDSLIRTWLEEGERYAEQGDFGRALERFEQILARNEAHVEALNNMGVIRFHQGYFDHAISYLERAISADGDHIASVENLAQCLLAKQEYLRVAELLRRPLEKGAATPGLIGVMARAFLGLEDVGAAKGLLKHALSLDPGQSDLKELLQGLESPQDTGASLHHRKNRATRVGFVTLWHERGHAYVTKMMRDALSSPFETFVLARNGGVAGATLLCTEGEWAVPNLTPCADYEIPQRSFVRWVVENRLDVVVFNEEYHLRLVRACREAGAKAIGYYVWELFPPEFVETCNELYDRILCQTDACYRHFSRMGLRNLLRLPWGIDRRLFYPHEHRGSAAPVLFFHPAGWGGLHGRRGTREVIEAFRAASLSDARLVVHTQEGHGREENGPVTILHGTIPREELASLYRDADVALLPSKWEGLGLTFLESIGCGLPIITVDAPPMNEFVRDGVSGLLCRVKEWASYPGIFVKAACVDVEDMAAKMRRIMDPALRADMKEASRILADAYSPDKFQQGLTEAVAEVISGKGIRLHLGCGSDRREGYLNVDLSERKGVDLVADAALCPLRSGSVSEILADGLLDRLPMEATDRVLSEWKRILKEEGTLKIHGLDLRQLSRAFIRNRLSVQEFSKRVYGGEGEETEHRLSGLDIPEVKRRLRRSGFEIREVGSRGGTQSISARLHQPRKGPLRILLISARFSNYPFGTGNFIHKALTRLGHQVVDIDFRRDHDRLEELMREPVDLVLAYKGSAVTPRLLELKSCPAVLWYPDDVLTQTHAVQDLTQNGYAYDHIYYFDEAGVPALHQMGMRHSSFLPLATDPITYRYIPDTPKIYDVSFIGSIYPNRRALLDRLKSRFNVFETTAFMDEMVRIMNRSRIVLNLGVGRTGYQLRVFEALGCRSFLLTNEIDEGQRLFKDREHLVYFNDENIEERIAYYLSHEEEREAIAEAGYREVLAKHTFEARMREILSDLEPSAMEKTSEPAGPENAAVRTRRIRRIRRSPSAGMTGEKSPAPQTLSVESHPCARSLERPLRILAAFAHFNWEDHNLQPALQEFGEVVRLRWPPQNQYDEAWHSSGKQDFNRRLLQEVKRAHDRAPVDVFFSYLSGRLVFPSTIRAIGMLGIPTVNLFLDDRHKFYGRLEPSGFAGMVDIAGAFTLCCTSSEYALELYRSVGAPVLHLPEGANPNIYRPCDLPLDIDVSFVGQCYGARADLVARLRQEGIRVETFGRGWPSGEIPVGEMVRLYSRSRINLGFAMAGESDSAFCLKGRDFEIPMSGGLYLTQYHPELDRVYDVGKEIACYRDPRDLAEKIRYYLQHPDEAEAIRQSGRRRALKDHTWTSRLHKAFSAAGLRVPPAPPEPEMEKGKEGLPVEVRGEGDGAKARDALLLRMARSSFASAVSGESSPPAVASQTADDESYYARVGQENATAKSRAVRDFVLSKTDIRFLLDVGCNTGEMSAQFIPCGIQVLGLDASDKIVPRPGYRRLRQDVTNFNEVLLSDCTLFLSLYHHVFWSKGMEYADRLFYQLLLRSRCLVFDCGNVLETSPYRQRWVEALRRHFSSERELLDHFGIPYREIGRWNTGGATRTIVVFERESFDRNARVVDEFRRKCGSPAQKEGLFSARRIDDARPFFDKTHFFKLSLAGRSFFGKKHLVPENEASEVDNLVEVYKRFPSEELLTFYGLSDRFGLLYEWLDELRYIGKVRDEWVHGLLLQDADRIEVNGKVKYIDFWSDPLKGPMKKASDGSIEDWMREGEAAYASGDRNKARERFQEVLRKDPGHWAAINNLGVIAFAEGETELAESFFEKAHTLCPANGDAMENLARCLERKGRYREALEWLGKIISSGAASVEILNKAGNCFMQLEDLTGAREVYEESLRRDRTQEKIRALLKGIEEMSALQPAAAAVLSSGCAESASGEK